MATLSNFLDKKPCLMGIINATPDSFSDPGLHLDHSRAISDAQSMIENCAAIIDIGGESTRPQAQSINSEVESSRIIDLVSHLASDVFVSVDTFRSKTAERVLKAGAKMINDVSALRFDKNMVSVVKEHEAYICLMFSKEQDSHPHATSKNVTYEDCVSTIIDFLKMRIDFCLRHDIAKEKIILDPGMGAFISTDPKYSWEVLERLSEIKETFYDFPLLIGASRKGFLGGALPERDPISQLVAVAAATKGANIIRTHNVAMAQSFFKTWQMLHKNDPVSTP